MNAHYFFGSRYRFAAAFSCVAFCTGASLYACSSDDTPANPGNDGGTDAALRPDTNPGDQPDTGQPNTGDGGADAQPTTCVFGVSAADGGLKNPYCQAPVCAGLGQNTDYQLNTGDPPCNNCLRTHCCAETTACFGNGKPPGEGGVPEQGACGGLDGCTFGCVNAEDAGGCRRDCESQFDAGIVTLHTAWGNCANTHCTNYPSTFNDGGTLCGTQFPP